jgi:hypothetical protein
MMKIGDAVDDLRPAVPPCQVETGRRVLHSMEVDKIELPPTSLVSVLDDTS